MGIVELSGVALASLLSENFILVTCMGISSRQETIRNAGDALRTGLCLTVVMVLASLGAWCTNLLFFQRFGLEHFRLLFLALLVPALVAAFRWLVRTCLPSLSPLIDGCIASVASNCAALGSALLVVERSYGFWSTLLFSLFGGLGAALAMASFAGLREEINLEHCPQAFRGIPILLVTAGLMALSLVGFYGLHIS